MNSLDTPLVCIVDDDDMVRESICLLVRTVGMKAHGMASARDFLAAPHARECDCLVLDVRMPGLSGIELQKRLAQDLPDLPVIFVSGHGDIPMAVQAMRDGAVDFLQKPFSEQALLDRIHCAVELSRSRRRKQLGRASTEARYALLTSREREVLDGILAGNQNKQIADALRISVRTVEQHRAHIMKKMRAGSVAELVAAVGALPRTD